MLFTQTYSVLSTESKRPACRQDRKGAVCATTQLHRDWDESDIFWMCTSEPQRGHGGHRLSFPFCTIAGLNDEEVYLGKSSASLNYLSLHSKTPLHYCINYLWSAVTCANLSSASQLEPPVSLSHAIDVIPMMGPDTCAGIFSIQHIYLSPAIVFFQHPLTPMVAIPLKSRKKSWCFVFTF